MWDAALARRKVNAECVPEPFQESSMVGSHAATLRVDAPALAADGAAMVAAEDAGREFTARDGRKTALLRLTTQKVGDYVI